MRDWPHVEDHCRGIEAVLQRGRPGETYNIGGGDELPNMTVIDELCSTVDRTFAQTPALAERFPSTPQAHGLPTATLKTFISDRAGHDRRYSIDSSKAYTELGYAPRRSFQQGLAETLQWYLDHEDWWHPLANVKSGTETAHRKNDCHPNSELSEVKS